jgi:hypothetical protein
VEAVGAGLQENRGVGLRQCWQVEEDLGFFRVGHRRFFEKDMPAGAEGANGPLEMQAVGQWHQNSVDVGVVEDF